MWSATALGYAVWLLRSCGAAEWRKARSGRFLFGLLSSPVVFLGGAAVRPSLIKKYSMIEQRKRSQITAGCHVRHVRPSSP